MRCPVCHTENDSSHNGCSNCKAALLSQGAAEERPTPAARRKSRRRSDPNADAPFSPYAEGLNREASNVYRLCLLGMIPFVGLVLGPLSVWRAKRLERKGKEDPEFTAHLPVRAAVVIGALAGATQWLGLGLMILGLLLP
jgi:hypothetical protein